jgi:hypothetical protein
MTTGLSAQAAKPHSDSVEPIWRVENAAPAAESGDDARSDVPVVLQI